jgi:hypothetical protein
VRGVLEEQPDDELDVEDARQVEITGKSLGRLGKLIHFDAITKVIYVPLSIITGSRDDGDSTTLRVPEWWARNQGLIG